MGYAEIDRYVCEDMRLLWSARNKYEIWAQVERTTRREQIGAGAVASDDTDRPAPTPELVAEHEARTGHEMTAFLSAWGAHHTHAGLTSSDVIDIEQTVRVLESHGHIVEASLLLQDALVRKAQDAPAIGWARTHGRLAAPTGGGHLLFEAAAELSDATKTLEHHAGRLRGSGKLRGPVGAYCVPLLTPPIELAVLAEFGLRPASHATQVSPRHPLRGWANAAASVAQAAAQLALNVRLACQDGVDEASIRRAASHTGSSSMPHKVNPKEWEQVCGVAALAVSAARTLDSTAGLWGHRDLSNSSVERVALPTVSAYTCHTLHTATRGLQSLEWHPRQEGPNSAARMVSAAPAAGYWKARELGIS